MGFFDSINPFKFISNLSPLNIFGIDPSANSDRENYTEQLQQQLAGLMGQRPDLAGLYQQGSQNVMDSYRPFQGLSNPSTLTYNPLQSTSLDKYYSSAKQGLNQTLGQNVSDAASQAGALAGARGFANPSGFTASQTAQARNAFNPQFAQLEADKARSMMDLERYNSQQQMDVNRANTGIQNQFAMYNNQGLNQSNNQYTNLLQSLLSGRMNSAQGDWANQMGLFNTQSGLSQNYDPYTGFDKFVNFASSAAPTGIAALASDIRVKENITPSGEMNGYNLYDFNYKGDNRRYRGVIAQEIQSTIPDAVMEKDGILYVDYSKLGFEMQEVN